MLFVCILGWMYIKTKDGQYPNEYHSIIFIHISPSLFQASLQQAFMKALKTAKPRKKLTISFLTQPSSDNGRSGLI